MKIHEYQAKEVLKKFGVVVPRSVPCFSVDEAVKAAQSLAEAGETGQRAFLRFIVKLFVLAEARAEAHRFAQ